MKTPPRREALSRERILRTALAIVDREQLEAISMRRIGEELGVEAMSLYNHVANKAAILDGIFETLLGELPPAKPSRSWQAALRDRARSLRSTLRTHPHVLPLFATRPAVTPASLVYVEAVLGILHNAGFRPAFALNILQVLIAFVVGHTIATCSPTESEEGSQPAYDRLSEKTFPRVREAARLLATHDVEKEFDFGLNALLSAFERRLVKRSDRKRSSEPRGASIAI
jgi:AcrR family transcriptional regulator